MQEEGDRKKLSVGEALEAMRQGRSQKASPLANAEVQLRTHRIAPAFWLKHLQHNLQRGRDQLFDALSVGDSADSGLRRRDLVAGELITIPTECLQRVVPAPSGPAILKFGRMPISECYTPTEINRRFQEASADQILVDGQAEVVEQAPPSPLKWV